MSFKDFMGRSFGPGIARPYADFLDDIEIAIENQMASNPPLTKFCSALVDRDFILVLGKEFAIFCLSRGAYRRYPFRATTKWEDFCRFPEETLIHLFPNLLNEAVKMDLAAFNVALQEKNNFISPVFVTFSFKTSFSSIGGQPSGCFAPADSVEGMQYQQMVKSIAGIIVESETSHYKAYLEMQKPKDIFLSHKSVDKNVVREISATLSAMGHTPWLDEDRMKAGANLARALKKGFDDSCAAVFFVTPNFVDEGFLADEIDYALEQKRQLGERFSIITLLLPGPDGNFGQVPHMLRRFVWKEVQTIAIVRTIVEAIPIRLGATEWREQH